MKNICHNFYKTIIFNASALQVWAVQPAYVGVSIRPRPYFSPSYNKVKSQTKHVWLLTLFIFLVYPFQLNGSKSA